MAENSKIQWTTHTFNPWRGCSKVAAGCVNCYADRQSKRNPQTLGIWGPDGTRVVAAEGMWREPIKWNKAAGLLPNRIVRPGSVPVEYMAVPRPRVFCASLADVFEDWQHDLRDSQGRRLWTNESVGEWETDDGKEGFAFRRHWTTLDEVRGRLFRLIDQTPNLDWLLLTKRPENIRRMIPAFFPGGYIAEAGRMNQEGPRHNLWLGTSIACQEDADENIPELLKCRDLAPVLFLSLEPLIGPVKLRAFCPGCGKLLLGSLSPTCGTCHSATIRPDWVIVGGESGPHARPCHVDWIRSIVRQCREAGVPCFVKQLGAFPIGSCADGVDAADVRAMPDFYRLASVTDPKGGDPDEWPEDLCVRQFPGEAI